MIHPLLDNPETPECLRRLFARVTCRLVCRFDDGSENSINYMSRQQAEAEAEAEAHYRPLIGTGRFRPMPRKDGTAGADRRLVSVEVVDL